MRVSVIGTGSIGQRHARNIKALGHILTLCDEDRDRARSLGHELDCTVVQHMRSLCEGGQFVSDSDAVLICTPASTHAAVARELLDAGYLGPLFIEKPIATSVEDAEIFTRWPHPTTMVGYNWRFHQDVIDVLVKDSRAGFHFECVTNIADWHGDHYADPLLECSHEIDLALSLGARFCFAGAFIEPGMWLQFQEPSVLVEVYWASKRQAERFISVSGPELWSLVSLDFGERRDRSYADEVAHFLNCAEHGVPTKTPFADGLRVLDVIAQAEAMARQRA